MYSCTVTDPLKANSLINTAVAECSIGHLKAVVLDELHMVDDEHRGYILELIATKLLSLDHPVQMVGMSATIPVRCYKPTALCPRSHFASVLYFLRLTISEHGPNG